MNESTAATEEIRAVRPRIVTLEIRGFRSFGVESRVLQLDAPLVVVHAGNSQGKSSLAEAIEFLISGRSSRRDLLGGAKAEYNDSLRNAHMPDSDTDVYVEAVVRAVDGTTLRFRRELLSDFAQGTECQSRLLLDGVEVSDLGDVGLLLADPPVRAPVLLQHILRHVLSTEPKQRVGYFKALLSLTDLDQLRERLRTAKDRIETEPRGSLDLVDRLGGTPASVGATAIAALTKRSIAPEDARTAVEAALVSAGRAVFENARLASEGDDAGEGANTPTLDSVGDLDVAVTAKLAELSEHSFPVAAFAPTTSGAGAVTALDLSDYHAALSVASPDAARLSMLFEALLGLEEYEAVADPADCPVCGTKHALTAQRIVELRDHLRHTEEVDRAAKVAVQAIGDARRDLGRLQVVAPTTTSWTDEEALSAQEGLTELGIDSALLSAARSAGAAVAAAAVVVENAITKTRAVLAEATDAIAGRNPVPVGFGDRYSELTVALAAFGVAYEAYSGPANALLAAVGAATRERITVPGLRELAALLPIFDVIVENVVAEGSRQAAIKRANSAEKTLREAASAVLDDRFSQMSDAITEWWTTIRPEELVGFGGIKRRAGGALFVNLVAALRSDLGGDPIERDALGVYSDSQLNALGLSIFLARTQLLDVPIVVLDDPIPGSDADHRLTFVQNTLGRLLDGNVQVILTTFDSKLAEWAQANHDWRGHVAYELTLLDATEGTDATQTSDTFSRLILEAEENLNSPTSRGRRAACGSYRSAAERLAKQIVATGRTHDGQATSVDEVDAEASVLGALVPLVLGYAIDNAEKGQWRTFATVLNPGNHDDDVPSSTELKQVRGNLRKIAKSHRAHWPDGLIL